jgi:hypothetical protein
MKTRKEQSRLCRRAACLWTLLFLFPASLPAQNASQSPGWVVIPVEEYRSLRARAFPVEPDPDKLPVDATLTRVDYDLSVNGELATGHATLTVDVLKDGWVRVAIPSGLLVREAKLDGKPVSLAPSEAGKSGRLAALLSHSGRAMLLLDIALPVASDAGEESVVLPASTSGVTRATIQLPRAGVDVSIKGGLLAEPSGSSAASPQAEWVAYGKGNEPLTFTWRKKLEDHRAEQPLRMRGSLAELVGLGEDITTISVQVAVEINQGAAREARIRLPEGVTVNQVSGAMVADWQAKAGELSIAFLEPVEQSARFVITGETHTAREGTIQVPIFLLLNAERETGGVAVDVLGAGEIKDLHAQGLENTDVSELGEIASNRQSPSLAAFRFRSGDPAFPRSLSVNVARYTQQAVLLANVEEARYQVLLSSEGKTLVQGRYAVRNNQKNFLKIMLPAGATLWSAELSGRPVRPGQSPDGGVLLPLEKSHAGDEAPEFPVEVVYFVRDVAWQEKGQVKLMLPAIDLPVSRTGVVLYHPPLFRLTLSPGPFRVQTYEEPTSSALAPPPANGQGAVGAALGGVGGGIGGGTFHKEKDAPSPIMAPPASPPPVQEFAESYWSKGGTRSARVLPVTVFFPPFGPTLFVVSELTEENHSGLMELSYQRDKKAGAQ